MSDLRVEYLKAVGTQPIASTAIAASIFTYISMIGLALEKNNCSVFELRLWLVGVLVHSVLNLTIKIYQNRINSNGSNAPREDIRRLTQCGETLEIIGYVWFVLGNILFLENLNSRKESPFIFFLCVIYFSASYISWLLFHAIQISLIVYPPNSAEARRYWLENRYVYRRIDRDDEFLADLEFTYQAQNPTAEEGEGLLSAKQVKFWNAWLLSYGCYDIPYRAISSAVFIPVPVRESVQSLEDSQTQRESVQLAPLELTMDVESTAGGSLSIQQADTEVCSICLSSLVPSAADAGCRATSPCAVQCETPHSDSGLLDFAFSSASAANSPRGDAQSQLACTVIVRYPCVGKHYFHAHCLHRWMQAASAWEYDMYGREKVAIATCPCCRQTPALSKQF